MAERYRKVQVEIWSDEHFRLLSDDAQFIFLFILTHPAMTAFGAMRGNIPGLAAEKGWTLERFRQSFAELLNKPFLKYDDKASLIVLPKFLKHNRPRNPNGVASWEKVIPTLPHCKLLTQHLQEVRAEVEAMEQSFAQSLGESFSEQSLNHSGNREREREREREEEEPLLSDKSDVPAPETPKPPRRSNGRVKYSDVFEEFWKPYPRKAGSKSQAFKAWRKVTGDNWFIAMALISAVQAQSRWHVKPLQNDIHTCHASTWLNGERWLDEEAVEAHPPPPDGTEGYTNAKDIDF